MSAELSIQDIDTPAVLVDIDIVEQNLREMADVAARYRVRLRPHTKTHKSPYFAYRQVALGAAGITVAKLSEAEVMANNGLGDILVAYPIVGQLKLRRLARLLHQVRVIVSLDSVEVAEPLSELGDKLGQKIPVYVEVDTGLGRMGRPPGEPTAAFVQELLRFSGIEVLGLMTHAGHAYGAMARSEIETIARYEGESLMETQARLRDRGIDVPEISVGSTPTARLAAQVSGVTEIRPGTYIFNDAITVSTGAASWNDCALTVLATVVARPTRDRAIIDAGTKTLAADRHPHPGHGMGHIIGHEDLILTRLTEEHGIVQARQDNSIIPLRIGDRVRVIPNHVCPVVNLADDVFLIRGDRVVAQLPVYARGKRI